MGVTWKYHPTLYYASSSFETSKPYPNTSSSDKTSTGGNFAASKKKGGIPKWLPNIRKLSQGRTSEKTSDATTKNLPLSRESKSNFKLSKPPMGNKHSEPPQAASGSHEGRLVVTSTKD